MGITYFVPILGMNIHLPPYFDVHQGRVLTHSQVRGVLAQKTAPRGPKKPQVVVSGAGPAGLLAARSILQHRPGVELRIYEKRGRDALLTAIGLDLSTLTFLEIKGFCQGGQQQPSSPVL